MGKPRMILLIRHAQSEGNKNRDIHQFIPDHRVKLTQDGWQQAEEAGRRLRSMLKPDDTIQFFTSPYRRTRETTEGILKTLTSDDPGPSPFKRHKIKVFEEPRLREQDFGNFQPCSAEMERMWQERADYGHFFYRIPNGESAADAYDRISGFNESLWRQFGEEDFPSVCVLVTHGLMTRVFLMKWYHWSVEYFEDLRNVNHCEFIVMKQNPDSKKFILENEMRTWSDLKRRTATINTALGTANTTTSPASTNAPAVPIRKWGGCANGCNHDQLNWPKKNQPRRQNTKDFIQVAADRQLIPESAKEDTPLATASPPKSVSKSSSGTKLTLNSSKTSLKTPVLSDISDHAESPLLTSGSHAGADADASGSSDENDLSSPNTKPLTFSHASSHPTKSSTKTSSSALNLPNRGREWSGNGLRSGAASPNELFSEDSDYYPKPSAQPEKQPRSIATVFGSSSTANPGDAKTRPRGSSRSSNPSQTRKNSIRKQQKTEAQWTAESGMGVGRRADTLGDGDEGTEGEEGGKEGEGVEKEKIEDRKSLSEVY